MVRVTVGIPETVSTEIPAGEGAVMGTRLMAVAEKPPMLAHLPPILHTTAPVQAAKVGRTTLVRPTFVRPKPWWAQLMAKPAAFAASVPDATLWNISVATIRSWSFSRPMVNMAANCSTFAIC